jgi:hypothetical protein
VVDVGAVPEVVACARVQDGREGAIIAAIAAMRVHNFRAGVRMGVLGIADGVAGVYPSFVVEV